MPPPHSSFLSPLRMLLLSNALEMLAVALVLPAYPDLTKALGISLQTRGLMVSLFSLLQFLSSPILGRGSDVLGRSFMLRVSAVASLFCYVCMLVAKDQRTFMLGRVLPGFFKCSISVSQAYISDISSPQVRAKNMGMMGSMFGLAFIIGPAVGGFLMSKDPWLTVWVALLATAANFILLLSLPEPSTHSAPPNLRGEGSERKANVPNPKEEGSERKANANGTTAVNGKGSVASRSKDGVWDLIRHGPQGGQVAVLLARKVFVAMSSGIFETSFANYASKHLGMDGQTLGLLLSFLGVVSVVNNVFIVRWLSNSFQDHQLIFPAIVGQAFSTFCWGHVYNLASLLPVLASLTITGSIFQTLLSTELSTVTPHALVGTVLGISYAIETFAKILTPFLGGYLLERHGGHALGFVSALFLLPVCAHVAFTEFFKVRKVVQEDKKEK
ncbi:major facilitator superfamily mfs_1 [Nannochloropsis gaditana]|uniref:Major facilitator superfamily mfs_1 n=1 Tax=Nannochloropsis gaditana TaxID=72520 RepID=W7TQ05_9STRA|nr:major facilitator superfamily mfs_1 [Nannochloropsis gaditana]